MKVPHCWKSLVTAHLLEAFVYINKYQTIMSWSKCLPEIQQLRKDTHASVDGRDVEDLTLA